MSLFKRWASCGSLALALVGVSAEKACSAESDHQERVSCSAGVSYIQRLTKLQAGSVGDLELSELDSDSDLNTGSVLTSSAMAKCDSFDKWPNVDNGVTCGGCKALVLTAEYGGRCDRYCESFGHACAAAAEEHAETCQELYTKPCNEAISGTSDMLCTCHRPPGPMPAPAEAPKPSPHEETCCKPFGLWPDVDNGVTCGACTALVLTAPYGGRCDKYCASFGHDCVAASEEDEEGCHIMYSGHCSVEIANTSDMLCTCRLPQAGTSCELTRELTPPPEPAPAPHTEIPSPQLPGTRKRIEIKGRQLLVDGKPLHLKGVAWNPTPKGSSGQDFPRFVEQDADLMVQAGINAVRTYSHIGDRSVLDALWARGIWVVNSVFNTGDPSRVASRVQQVKDHPAILMWTIGNEWNYNGLYSGMSQSSAIARVAEVARIVKSNDAAHPVASIYGSVPSRDVISALHDVDIWGLNVYKGIGFGDTFDKFARRSEKPMFFGEYGADAFDARQGREDQASQAKATKVLSEAIAMRSSVRAGGVCLGGFVFEFADEWWKDQAGSKSRHDVGGIAPGGGPHPDATFNEEWWGLVDIDRRPREAFHAYAAVPIPTEG